MRREIRAVSEYIYLILIRIIEVDIGKNISLKTKINTSVQSLKIYILRRLEYLADSVDLNIVSNRSFLEWKTTSLILSITSCNCLNQ